MTSVRQQIEERGYAVIPHVVPRENVDAVVADIWRHTGADPDDPQTWYQPDRVAATGMVEMYHYQSMWDNRQLPAVYELFSQIHGTERLWVSIDRTNLKPPSTPDHPAYKGLGIHWDADLSKYPDLPFRLQGVLALADTDEDMGGFQCVPEIYRDLDGYIARHGRSRRADMSSYSVTKVPLRAGDMVLWSNLLAHGNGDNLGRRPRLAQYLSMNPVAEADEELRRQRVEAWRSNSPMAGRRAFPGDPRRIEQVRSEPARLTDLGRKLLGLDSW